MIFSVLLLIILGALIHFGKCYDLIAGYNTLPKEKKERIKKDGIIIKLSRATLIMSWGAGFSLLAEHFVFDYFNINIPHFPLLIFAVWIFPTIIYLNWKYRKYWK